MLRFHRFPLLLILCTFFSGYLHGQAWSGILSPGRAIDWSQAGSAHINDVRTQCVTTQCATVSGGTVTAASINAALASAPANTYVLIPAGTYAMSSGLTFNGRSNISLRGAGSNSTFLVFASSSNSGSCNGHDVCAMSSDLNYTQSPSNTATLSGTNGVSGSYTKGATSIILSSKTNLAVGNPIILDQLDDQSDTGGLYIGCEINQGDSSPACYFNNDGPSGYQRGSTTSTIRGQQQIVTVTSISGTGPYNIGITPGIYAPNYQTSHSPGAWWATNPVINDGIENLSLDHTSGGDGITFMNCSGCWVKGVRGIRSSATPTGWYHVGMLYSTHITVRDSYFYGYDGDAYGISSYSASDSLSVNNIVQRGGSPFFFNSDCEGCVAAYNFSLNATSSSTNWLSGSYMYHSIDLFTLLEGNIGAQVYADSFHGTHAFNTTFRNRFDGREQNNGNATSSSTIALRISSGARYNNAVGNVLGTAGYQTVYKDTPGSSLNNDLSVIDAGVYPETSTNDSLANPTSVFWGNWDVVTNGVRWNAAEVPSGLSSYANPVPASQTLPASFYLSSKPAWWPSTKAWPAIGPDVTGGNVGQCVGGTMATSACTSNSQCTGGGSCSVIAGGKVVSNPAMDCYLNTMGGPANGTGSALKFDAAACYSSSSSSGGVVNPPSGLTVIVH